MKIFNNLKNTIKDISSISKFSNSINKSAISKESIFTSKNFDNSIIKTMPEINPAKHEKFMEYMAANKKLLIEPSFTSKYNNQELLSYAKTKCIKSLSSSEPKETLIFVDKSKQKIVGEYEGMFDKCYVPSSTVTKLNKYTEGLHGHPSFIFEGREVTAPISLQDFAFLNKTKLAKYTAFNKKGEFSSLEKKNTFSSLSEKQMNDLESEYFNHLIDSLPKKEMSKAKELLSSYQKDNNVIAGENLIEMVNNYQFTRRGMLATDTFWNKVADKLGLEYKTDFSF